jgi:hypothetical protein
VAASDLASRVLRSLTALARSMRAIPAIVGGVFAAHGAKAAPLPPATAAAV